MRGKDDYIFEGTNQEGNAGAATLTCGALYACWAEIQQCLLELESESSGVLEDFIIKSRSKEKFPAIPDTLRESVSACALGIRKSKSLARKSCALMTRLLDEQASSENTRQGVVIAPQMCTAVHRHIESMYSRTHTLGGLLDVCKDESAKQSCGVWQTEVSARLQALIQLGHELEELCICTSLEMEDKYPSPVVPPEENQKRASVLEILQYFAATNNDKIVDAIGLADQLSEEVKALSLEPRTEKEILAVLCPVRALCNDIRFHNWTMLEHLRLLDTDAGRLHCGDFEWKCKVHTLTRNAWEELEAPHRYMTAHLGTIANILLSTPGGGTREYSYINRCVRPIFEKSEELSFIILSLRARVSECIKLCQEESGSEDDHYTIVDAIREDNEIEQQLPSRLQEITDTTGEESDTKKKESEKKSRMIPPRRPWQERAKAAEIEQQLPSRLQERTDTTGEDSGEESLVIPAQKLQEAADITGEESDTKEKESEKKSRMIPPRRPWQERAKAAFASFAVASALLLQGMLLAALYLLFFPLYVIWIFGKLLFFAVKKIAKRVARDTDEPGSRTNHCKTAGAYSLAIALVVVTSPILLLLAIAISILGTLQEIVFHAATAPFKAAKSCYNTCMEKFQQEEGGGVIGPCIRECILQSTYEQLREAGCCKGVLALFNKHFSPESNLENTDVSVVTENTERICP